MRTPTNSLRCSSIRIGNGNDYHRRVLPVNSREERGRVDEGGGSDADADGGAWSVYLLRCADGTLYAGATNDLARRLRAHAAGRVKYTRGRLPVALAYAERVGTRGAAL